MATDLAALTNDVRTRLSGLGFELVDIRVGGTPSRTRLQIRIDWLDSISGRGITVENCATASRALEQWLDETGQLGDRYILEVSSPGIERPVRWREHWTRFVGHDVNVRLRGRGRIRASIVRVLDERDEVVLRPAGEGNDLVVAFTDARDATLAVNWDAEQRGHR
jgi:ribosome maturation factor RimP